MSTTYTPTNLRLVVLSGKNCTVDDALINATATGANALLATASSTGTGSLAATAVAADVDVLIAKATDKTDFAQFLGIDKVNTITASTAAVKTRNALGDYSYNRTAGGAETHYFSASVPSIVRTSAGKGFKLTSFKTLYTLGVADATTDVTITANQVTHTDRSAAVVASHGGTLTFDVNHDTASERIASAGGSNPHVATATFGTPAFQVTANVDVTLEAAFILANTGTLKFYGFEVFYTADYL